MFGLIKKDLLFASFAALAALPLLAAYLINKNDPLDFGIIYITGNFMILLVLNAVMGVEMIESKFKGYAFLSTLPITSEQIVTSKFLLILTLDIAYLLYSYILFYLLESSPDIMTLGRIYILIMAVINLVVAALIFCGIFRFGFTKFMKVVIYGLPISILLFLTVFIEKNYEYIDTLDSKILIEYVTPTLVLMIILGGAVVYYVFLQLAKKLMRSRQDKLEW